MKKFVSVLLVFIMVVAALPVLADSAAEEVLLKVKGKINVPEELGEFNYSESTYDGVLRYDFTWHTEDYSKEMYVSADADGEIISYNYYEQTDYSSDRTLIGYTIDDARPLAEEFLKDVFPQFDTLGMDILRMKEETSSYSGRYKTFVFVFERRYIPYAVESNSVTVRIRATKDKMYVQSMYASLDNSDDVFEGGEAEVKYELTEADYVEKFPIELYYAKDYSGEEEKVSLFYSVDKGFVSLVDRETVTQVYFDRYADKGYGAEDSVATETTLGSLSRNEALTEAEIKALEEVEGLVAVTEIEEKLRSLEIFRITDDMKLTSSSVRKYDEKYMAYFTLKGDVRTASVTYNGETGEIININTYFNVWSKDEKKEVSREAKEAVKEDMTALVKSLAGNKIDETETTFTETETAVYMTSVRMVNGVKYPGNSIAVTYNADKDMATSYRIEWDEDVSQFPKVEEAIGFNKAAERVFEIAPVYKALVRGEGGYVPAITIPGGVTINAVTGEEPYTNKADKVKYTDVDTHWARDAINILWEHDIYLEGERFMPGEAVNQADMVRLFSACRDSGVIPVGWTKKRIAEYAVTNGYIEVAEPDKTMTRREAFKVMIEILGYGDVAEFDIYKSSYTDMDADGSAEILKAMGVLTGDTARPDDMLTRAEAAVMVYRYLSK